MAKTKQKSRSDSEHMRGIIREYEKEIRSLRQQLRQFEKYEQHSQDEEYKLDNEDTYVDLKMVKNCSSCGKGKIVETLAIMGKIYGTCNICEHKERMK